MGSIGNIAPDRIYEINFFSDFNTIKREFETLSFSSPCIPRMLIEGSTASTSWICTLAVGHQRSWQSISSYACNAQCSVFPTSGMPWIIQRDGRSREDGRNARSSCSSLSQDHYERHPQSTSAGLAKADRPTTTQPRIVNPHHVDAVVE